MELPSEATLAPYSHTWVAETVAKPVLALGLSRQAPIAAVALLSPDFSYLEHSAEHVALTRAGSPCIQRTSPREISPRARAVCESTIGHEHEGARRHAFHRHVQLPS